MKLAFIGGGNMASALIGGLIAKGQVASDIHVIEPYEAQRQQLLKNFDVTVFERVTVQAVDRDVIIMAIKPQHMHNAAVALAPLLNDQLVISVAAGIRAADLSRWLGGHQRIVRTMPNTPALIGAGITGAAGMGALSPADRALTTTILSAVGECLWVDTEDKLDAVTATSGSGPAYVFYFMEAMQTAARNLGLSDEQARRLTLSTFNGAARLAAQASEPVSVLRERVTSKGGTTAAGLAAFAAGDIARHIESGMQAANLRSIALGDEFGRDPP
jgi:pyrroline-5-carboxylate reductase